MNTFSLMLLIILAALFLVIVVAGALGFATVYTAALWAALATSLIGFFESVRR